MFRITENEDEIIVRDVPVGRGILLLIATGLIALFLFLLFDELEWHHSLFTGALGLLAFYFFLITPVTTTKINRQTKLVSVRKQSLLGYSFNVYSFDEIAGSIYVEVEDERSLITHQIVLPLKNGDKVELSIAKLYLGLSSAPTPTVDDPKGNLYFSTAQALNPYISDVSKQISSAFGDSDDGE